MQHHYSTVAADDKKRAIPQIIEPAGVRQALASGAPPKVVRGGAEDKRTAG
jgi:hypothetical protein